MNLLNLTILLFLTAIFSWYGNAQEIKTSKRFSAGILLSPDYSYRRLKMDDNPYKLIEMRNELETPKISYTSGIFLKYSINKQFALESGAQFSDKGEKMVIKTGELTDIFGNPVVDPAVPKKYTNTYRFQYVDIPLKLNWYFAGQNSRFFLSAGVSANIFLSGSDKNVGVFEDRTEIYYYNNDLDFSTINWAVVTGLGVEHNFLGNTGVRIEPVFRYSITPIADISVKEYPYSFGVNIVVFTNL